MEVLFTLLAGRYERGQCVADEQHGVQQMGPDLKDAMTTAAAIDRLVHHSVSLELNVLSYRVEKAKQSKSAS